MLGRRTNPSPLSPTPIPLSFFTASKRPTGKFSSFGGPISGKPENESRRHDIGLASPFASTRAPSPPPRLLRLVFPKPRQELRPERYRRLVGYGLRSRVIYWPQRKEMNRSLLSLSLWQGSRPQAAESPIPGDPFYPRATIVGCRQPRRVENQTSATCLTPPGSIPLHLRPIGRCTGPHRLLLKIDRPMAFPHHPRPRVLRLRPELFPAQGGRRHGRRLNLRHEIRDKYANDRAPQATSREASPE